MKIIALMENEARDPGLLAEHGFSLYIETDKHRLLMDTGASDDTWKNAEILGVDVRSAEFLFISHGHYDHAGGVMGLARMNPQVKIYLQKGAFGAFYHGERYIGMDPAIRHLNTVLLDGEYEIDEELSIFSGIEGRRIWPKSNLVLSEEVNGKTQQDQFGHEQCLVVREKGKTLLVTGCAHNGILNILDRYHELYDSWPDLVISGFHMMKKTEYTQEEITQIEETADELLKLPCMYYSGHCTGHPAYEMLKARMGDRLDAIHAGDILQPF